MQQTPYNYAEYHIRSHTLTKRAHMSEENGASRQDALEDKDKIQRINHSAKDQHKRLTGGVDRPLRSAEPGLQRVQVHLREESRARHLITFHMCICREPTSRAISRASLHPPSTHTHTHFIPFSPRRLSSILLS